jgi:biotin carboxylase
LPRKILFLGAARGQMPAIRYAREQGYYVITCDYLPSNPGHRLADECHNVSTTDLDGVLAVARRAKVDAVIAYATDPAAPTAAYVCNALGLPSNPYESVRVLTQKDLFRRFLADHGFKTPQWIACRSLAEAADGARGFRLPLVVKPTDSSGSKGVSVVRNFGELAAATQAAFAYSRSGAIVVEEYVEVADPATQLEGEGFLWDGELAFLALFDDLFDLKGNPVVPCGYSIPTVFPEEPQQQAKADLARLMRLLEMQRGPFNVDMRVDHEGQVFIIDLGPRNGGNLIPQLLERATGFDMLDFTLRSALGEDCSGIEHRPPRGFHATYVLHARQDGIFDRVELSDAARESLLEMDVWVSRGDPVRRFDGGDRFLGYVMFEFATRDGMKVVIENIDRHAAVVLQ